MSLLSRQPWKFEGRGILEHLKVLVLIALVWMTYGNVGHPFPLLAIVVGLAGFRQRKPVANIKPLDWMILAALLSEVLSLETSRYNANGLVASRTLFMSSLVYLFTRLAIRTTRQLLMLSLLIAGGGVALAWFGLTHFIREVQSLGAVGLSDVVAFRSRLIIPPSTWVLGEWFTMLLLTLPFAFGVLALLWSRRWRIPAVSATAMPLLIVSALLLSCSRSVFWSIVVFCGVTAGVMAAYQVVPVRSALILILGMASALGLVLFTENALFPGAAGAYTGLQTSQVRSTEGRLAIWRRSADVFRLSPLWGVGSGNAPLFLSSSADQDETTGFASRTFSLPIQVLTEKGAIGAALYLAVLVLAGWDTHRKLRDPKVSLQTKMLTCCLAAGVVAVLFRELTYSSLLEHTATGMLFTMSLALLATEEAA